MCFAKALRKSDKVQLGYWREFKRWATAQEIRRVASRCSRRFLRNCENLRSSAVTVGTSSKKRMLAKGIVDLSIMDSFQIPTHSFAMHRLPDQRPDNKVDLKGSGALEQTVNE